LKDTVKVPRVGLELLVQFAGLIFRPPVRSNGFIYPCTCIIKLSQFPIMWQSGFGFFGGSAMDFIQPSNLIANSYGTAQDIQNLKEN